VASTLSISSGSILLDGTTCGALATTDSIVVNGTGSLTIVGDFVPGQTPEPGGTSEIEFAINNDIITFDLGAGADAAIIGTTGADLYADGDQDVVLSGSQTQITFKGGAGNDTLDASAATGPIYLYGNGGVDHLIGGAGADFLYGANDADTLEGGDGADLLDGGPGNDVERGGAGNDVFKEGATANGADVLDGGANLDILDYGLRSGAVTVTIGDATANDGEPGENDAPAAIERVTGGAGADTITGSSPGNILRGGQGNDILRGGGGPDTLYGDGGDDYLDGETGGDTMYGGGGSDTLVGDAAAIDSFVCQGGNDTVVGNSDGLAETVSCGAGADTAQGNAEDTFTSCETLTP
jgi:Ca2+-binding RTX toxin-like protein